MGNDLVNVSLVDLAAWIDSLRPVRVKLLTALSVVYASGDRSDEERSQAADILADYAADQPQVLADLVMDADDKQFALFFPKFESMAVRGLPFLEGELSKKVALQSVSILSKTEIMTPKESIVKIEKSKYAPFLPAKNYSVKMKKGMTYTITMRSKELDSFLVLQDKDAKQLGWDDDSGGDLDAHLPFTATEDGLYNVYAAAFKGTGAFSLDIVEIDSQEAAKEKLAKRQANAAVAMLKMNQPEKVWPLLKHSPDPRMRSYLIHRFGPLGAAPGAIVKQLLEEKEVSIRRALILSLGDFGEKDFSPGQRQALLAQLQEMYRRESDPGIHASAEWLLRTWAQEEWLKQVNEELAKDREQREKRLEGIKQMPQWFVNSQGQWLVLIPGPANVAMGSPVTEAGRDYDEPPHKKRISRTFAMAAKPVTLAEYRRFDTSFSINEQYAPTPDCPVIRTSWFQAASYCNWLSAQEGIPEDQWCYQKNDKGEYADGMTLAPDYLKRTGYRLPTEAEMEYATRARGR